ncbi:MAG TPA: hypothetical protein VMH83_12245, partial [Candidatus Acidoferrum sp.]|nr:hypothetical protein [Candidatus Acidoferrum sp.]
PRGGPKPPPPQPLFFKETWKDISDNVPMTQDFVLNPDLTVAMFGAGDLGFGVTNEGGVPHIWTGNCASSCLLALSHKTSFVDLSGKKARVRWTSKTSGFHEVRPVLKLADGTWLIGDHVDAYTFDYHESEFYPAEVRWLKLDMPSVRGKGVLLNEVDLSKVDAIGFVDLTPGSGHGAGGFADVGWIEVYGTPVPRNQK